MQQDENSLEYEDDMSQTKFEEAKIPNMSKTRIDNIGEGSYMENINSNFDANSIEDDGDYSNLKGVIGGNIMHQQRAKGRNVEETKETGFDTNTHER